MRLRAGVVSDCGHVRFANEDSFLLRPGLYAVCDGMGGARAGEVASQMACVSLLGVDPQSAGLKDLREAIVKANLSIIQRSTSDSELLGMGTTLTAALIKDGSLFFAHVGDSRAYVLRDETLTQVTADHSWVGEMVRRGDITPAQAARHPHRSVITRALGTDVDLDPDVIELQAEPGDRVLLCSDGLTGMVDDETIARIMNSGAGAQTTAQSLVDAALANGGEDNVTVVIVDIQAAGEGGEGSEPEGEPAPDSRILVGPSNREAAPSASRGVERLSMAARERLRRRGAAVGRAGIHMSGATGAETRAALGEEESSAGLEASPSLKASGDEAAAATAETDSGTVPPPVGEVPGKKRKSRRREAGAKRRKGLTALVIVLLVLVLAVGGFAWYNSTVYYLGESNGKVALYQGFPWDLVGIEFSSVYMTATVDYQSLDPLDRARVDKHELVGKREGEQFLDGLSPQL
jgi:serine/threonine protein phosphatase PrpC